MNNSAARNLPAIGYRSIFQLAVPMVLANLSTPILGLVDTGVIGQLGEAASIGAVAVGAMIFNFVYWIFGFLRMGTTGLTAQAFGQADGDEIRQALARSLVIAGIAGILIVMCQAAIAWTAFGLLEMTPGVEAGAREYFAIRIWSAPFALANFAILGWLMGLQKSKTALLLQLFLNGLNAVLDALFVLHFDWGVQGIAAGSMIAEICAAGFGALIVARNLGKLPGSFLLRNLFDSWAFRRAWRVNRDIMVRTLFLLFAFGFFTAKSAQSGDIPLAVNSILMHFVSFSAYFLDGFAFAAEAFVGEAIGIGCKSRLLTSIRLSTTCSAVCALLLGVLIYFFGPAAIDLLTTNSEVREEGRRFLFWVALLPLVSLWCWQLDGIFIGATRTREMRIASFRSLMVFLGLWWISRVWGNDGLWLSLLLFNVARAIFLGIHFPEVLRSSSVSRSRA